MKKIIKNQWNHKSEDGFTIARILHYETCPEGLDIDRIRFNESGCLKPNPKGGHIISVMKGKARLSLPGEDQKPLNLEAGMHLYIPPLFECEFDAESGTEVLHVSSPSLTQTRGKRLLLRDERFLSACASNLQSLRWILTPQYLSRRIFLHHDHTLVSKSGYPVGWFHTTMFDVTGLPPNEDGNSVFKMSYNSRTEINVCYDVKGLARARMAIHPYATKKQPWGPWHDLDSDSSYHLNEAAGSSEEESYIDVLTHTLQTLRNKHEIDIKNGYVSLFCMFDPSPVGIERHQPGEYSDYEPLSKVVGTPEHKLHMQEIEKYDEMVNELSMAKAMGDLDSLHDTTMWRLYLQGSMAQAAIESNLFKNLIAEGKQREQVIEPWMCAHR